MQLHQLSRINKKGKQRVGRGGKRGTTSGRGTKGQRSRAGHKIRPALRDLIIRLPKRRGFRNKPKTAKARVINLALIAKNSALRTGDSQLVVDRAFLYAAGLIPAGYAGPVKILGNAELSAAINVRGIPTSKAVAAQIKKAGGAILPAGGGAAAPVQ